jgi:hypothetical protein
MGSIFGIPRLSIYDVGLSYTGLVANRQTQKQMMSERKRGRTTKALERRKRNRRAFPRWQLDFEVNVRLNKNWIRCRGYEIGEGGLSLASQTDLPLETEIDVQYRLDSQKTMVNVKGIVRYLEGGRFGIEFLSLGIKDRLAVVKYCEKLETL